MEKVRETYFNRKSLDELLLNEIKAELQYMENLLHYSEEFFNYPKTQEYHWYIDTPEKGSSHINNTI